MYILKRYSVSLVRERLADALDEAERGLPVIIERRGVLYRLSVDAPLKRRRSRPSRIETVDSAIEHGHWSWTWTASGVRLKGRRRS
jgi:hypothetical protein